MNMFDRYASYYDTFMKKTGLSNVKSLLECFDIVDGLHVADIGGGTGELAKELAERDAIVTIIDPSAAMTEIARAKHKRIHVLNAYAEMIPVMNNCFDVVCMRDCLHHIEKQECVVSEAARILRPSGKIVIHELVPDSPRSQMVYEMERMLGETIIEVSAGLLCDMMQKNQIRGDIKLISKFEYVFVGQKWS